MTAPAAFETHEVLNQAPPLENYNLFSTDLALREALKREGGAWAEESLTQFGARLGRAETIEHGRLANRFTPELRTHDRFGNRRDEVEFHPSWHAMMELGVNQGLHSAPWAEAKPGAHVARAAGVMLMVQIESGVQCPITMTYGSIPAMRRAPAAAAWLERALTRDYDPRFMPVAGKRGALIGMGMTEKQGGSDVRTNSTRAEAAGNGEYRVTGHKWFMSAPMCDAFLILAQAPGGLTCFFLPRWTADGELNAVRLQRLKEKLGNRSNASSEVEFHGARAWAVGDEGRGIPTILEMGTYTRLDCALGTAGLMRQALTQALHHARHRTAFQRRLIDQPLMQNVLADLGVESEAATALVMRLARAFDRQKDEAESALRRLLTPAVKYWICRRGPAFAFEAMEVLGGNGYVEESIMPRIFREMPVNSIWEGSGNVMCLDVLRAAARTPEALDAYMAELKAAAGASSALDGAAAKLGQDLRSGLADEAGARHLVERMVLALQGALLARHAPAAVADAFVATRLDQAGGRAAGTLPAGAEIPAIIERAWPL
jgi:putative acyl-CoA dehydrogenase